MALRGVSLELRRGRLASKVNKVCKTGFVTGRSLPIPTLSLTLYFVQRLSDNLLAKSPIYEVVGLLIVLQKRITQSLRLPGILAAWEEAKHCFGSVALTANPLKMN